MKFNYKLQKLCGTSYASSGSKKGANIAFYTTKNKSRSLLLSPAGNRIHIFDLTNGGAMRTLPIECRSDITCLAVSSGGLVCAVDVDNYALLLQLHVESSSNACSAVELHRFHFKRKVRCVSFSPTISNSSQQYLAVGFGNLVQVWLLHTLSIATQSANTNRNLTSSSDASMPFELHRTLSGFAADVICITWSSDGTCILAGARDHTAKLFTLFKVNKFMPVTFAGHKAPIIGAFFGGKNGNNVVYTVSTDGACFTWALDEDEKDQQSTSGVSFFTDNMPSVPSTFTTTGSEVGKSLANVIQCRSWKRQAKHYFNQNRTEVTSVEMNSVGLLVVGFSSGLFGLYEMPGCTNVHTLTISNRRISAAAINSTGDWLAFGCPELGQLLVWEWQSETYIIKQQGHSYAMRHMAFSPDGSQFIATAGEDGKVKMWNSDTGFCFVTFSEHTAPVTALTFANPKVILSASLDGTIRAHDLVRYKNFRTLTTPTPVQFCSMAADSSGEIVCAGTFDPFDIYMWSLQTGKVLDVLSGHKGPVVQLTFNPEQGKLASASWDGTVKLWDVYKKNTPQESLQHNSDVVCVAFRPDGKVVCAGTTKGLLIFWDVEDASIMHTIDGRKDIKGGRKINDRMTADNNASSRYFTSVCFTADGTCVLAGGNSKYVCIYEVSHQILLKKFQISYNRSLDGVLDKLNSKNLGDGGPIDGKDDSDDEMDPNFHLPGAKRNDDGSRKSKIEVLTTCVAFSSTGREWGTVSNEGLHIYSLDDDCFFDPVALNENVTPASVNQAIQFKQYGKALLMSMHLNEVSLVQVVIESIPLPAISLVVKSVTHVHLERLLHYIAKFITESPHIEYYLEWVLQLLQTHGRHLQKNHVKFMRAFRSMHRVLRTRYDELRTVCDDNRYALEFFEEQGLISLPS